MIWNVSYIFSAQKIISAAERDNHSWIVNFQYAFLLEIVSWCHWLNLGIKSRLLNK